MRKLIITQFIPFDEATENDMPLLIEFEQEIIKAERAFDDSLKVSDIQDML